MRKKKKKTFLISAPTQEFLYGTSTHFNEYLGYSRGYAKNVAQKKNDIEEAVSDHLIRSCGKIIEVKCKVCGY